MKHRITFFIVSAFFVIIFIISLSCNKKDSEAKPITIRWWHINSDKQSQVVFQNIANEFEKTNPDVIIKITMLDNMEYKPKLELDFAAGDPPDIFHSWGGGGLAEQVEAGHLRDITSYVKTDNWQSKISPIALEIYSHDGKIYGFPHDLGAVGFWYNKELLKKVGYTSFPETWHDFYKLCDRLKKAGITPISIGIADRWPVMYYWVYLAMRIGGEDLFSDIHKGNIKFNNPDLIKAGLIMQDLFKHGYFQSSSIGDDFITQSRYMGDGECAMQLMGQWAVAIQAQSAEKKDALSHLMMFAPFPSVKNGKGSIKDAMGGCNGFVIGKNAPDEAIEFLEFFTRAENLQKSFDVFPAIPTVNEVVIKNEGHKAVKKYLNTMSSFNLYPDQLFPLETGSMINEVSARIMLGELTPEEGCKILDRTWEASKD